VFPLFVASFVFQNREGKQTTDSHQKIQYFRNLVVSDEQNHMTYCGCSYAVGLPEAAPT
jgi:hypothetical protein